MRRPLSLLTAGLLALAVMAPSAQAAGPSPFTGHWVGADPAPPDGDGSTLHLSISGGSSPRIAFTDLYGSICANNEAPTVVFRSGLVGSVDGDHLDAVFAWARCGATAFDWLAGSPWSLHYDAASDTLSDGFATFHRQ